MNSENQTWGDVKSKYLREIEKALSAVKHPRIREVLDDVTSHLERRFSELSPQDRSWENFQTIITEMGPASDYAELLDPGSTKSKPRIAGRYVLIAASAAIVVAALLLAMTRGRNGDGIDAAATYIVTFKPVSQFNPQTSRELLNAFNRKHPRGVRTHHYRTQIADDALVGHICVDTPVGKNAIIDMLNDSDKLTFVESRRATKELLEKHNSLRQPSLRDRSKTPATTSRMRDEARKLAQLLQQWPEDDKLVNREEIVNQMFLTQNGGVEARFTAVSGARLLGQTREAVEMLKKASALFPNEKTPGMNLPVRFTAQYQMATIALHEDGAGEAAMAYEMALKETENLEAQWFLEALCLVHLAEIADETLRDKQTALKRLTEAMGILESVDTDKLTADWATALPILSGWMVYEYAKVNGTDASSNRLAYGDAKVDGVLGLAMMQMSLAGLEHPILLRRAAESDKSIIDSNLAKLALAFGSDNKGHNTESDKWLLNLSRSDSYFADFARKLRHTYLNSSTEH